MAQERQQRAYFYHQDQSRSVDNDGVDQIENAEAEQHPHIGQVIGKAGEQIAGPLFVEIVEVKGEQVRVHLFADAVLDSPGVVQQGCAGEYPYDAVQQGSSNNCHAEPGRSMRCFCRGLDALYCQLQQPGDQQGAAACPDKEQRSEQICRLMIPGYIYKVVSAVRWRIP